MKKTKFNNSIVALVTPFRNGGVDKNALRDLVEFHIGNSTSAILVCGTTGEAATLSDDERREVVRLVARASKRKIPVIAGTGTNDTEETIIRTKEAKSSGVDAVLIVTPYYNKPTQDGLILHYQKIAKSIDIPIIIYNVPSRTGVNILPETVCELSKIKNIIGIKEASGSLEQVSKIIGMCDTSFIVLSGDDSLTLPMLSIGAKGVISVVANIVPRDIAELCESFENANITRAQELHHRLFPLTKAMFLETNPIPVKNAMAVMGLIKKEVRLPLSNMSSDNLLKLKKIMKEYGL